MLKVWTGIGLVLCFTGDCAHHSFGDAGFAAFMLVLAAATLAHKSNVLPSYPAHCFIATAACVLYQHVHHSAATSGNHLGRSCCCRLAWL